MKDSEFSPIIIANAEKPNFRDQPRLRPDLFTMLAAPVARRSPTRRHRPDIVLQVRKVAFDPGTNFLTSSILSWTTRTERQGLAFHLVSKVKGPLVRRSSFRALSRIVGISGRVAATADTERLRRAAPTLENFITHLRCEALLPD